MRCYYIIITFLLSQSNINAQSIDKLAINSLTIDSLTIDTQKTNTVKKPISLDSLKKLEPWIISSEFKDGHWNFWGYQKKENANCKKYTSNCYEFKNIETFKVLINPYKSHEEKYKMNLPELYILAVPIRRNHSTKEGNIGISSLGFSIQFWNHYIDKYSFSGVESNRNYSLVGLYFGPSVQEKNEIDMLALDVGYSLLYAYKDLTFALIPFGVSIGNELQFWSGFSIGFKLNSIKKIEYKR